MSHQPHVAGVVRLTDAELADSLEQILKDCAPAEWIAYEVPEMQTKEACTVGHFGDWIVGSESNHPGGNYRDDDTGDDQAHAKFVAMVKNHAPQIIAAVRGISDGQNEVVRYIDSLFVSGNEIPVTKPWLSAETWAVVKDYLRHGLPLDHDRIEIERIYRQRTEAGLKAYSPLAAALAEAAK